MSSYRERLDRWYYTSGRCTVELNAIAAEADAEIAALKAERDALKKERHELSGELHIVQQREWLYEDDAARYRAFFDAGLPITFMGVEYHAKADLDAAIDTERKGSA
jgi:hypothetical protein